MLIMLTAVNATRADAIQYYSDAAFEYLLQ